MIEPGPASGDKDEIAIAVVGRPRGNRGEVVIHPHFDLRRECLVGIEALLRWPDGREQRLRVESLWWHAEKTICRFEGCGTIDEAREYCHCEIFVPRAALIPLDPEEFFAADLIGCEVIRNTGERLGVVASVDETGGAALLAIETQGGRELLIPFAAAIIKEIDMERRRLLVDPPPGLLELNED